VMNDFMETMEMFREIVREADIADIPPKYITAATILDDEGLERVLTGDDISLLLHNMEPYRGAKHVNVIFDLRLLAYDTVMAHSEMFTYIYNRMDEPE